MQSVTSAADRRMVSLALIRGFGYDATVHIRKYFDTDWPAVWPIIQGIVTAGDTFAYDPGWSSEQARDVWAEAPPGHTIVACDGPRVLLGTALMGPNRPGPGSHVSTAI